MFLHLAPSWMIIFLPKNNNNKNKTKKKANKKLTKLKQCETDISLDF